jgi:O-antigen/teichoic acid export membrane protein
MTISKAKTFRNIAYTSLTKGVTLICIAVTTSVVARNLSPSDYGVVGFAAIVIGFLRNFSDLGLDEAVIRRPVLDQNSLRTAFTLKIILSCSAFVVALLIAPFAWHLFDHPATGNVIRILALNFLVSTIGFLPLVMLTREMNYRALVIPGVIGSVVRAALAVTLILHGLSYWSVVVADVGATLAGGIAILFSRKFSLALGFDHKVMQEYLAFGLPLLGSGILVFLLLNLDNFLVGSVMGSTKLGYYALAFAWGSFICGLLSSTVNSVLLPTFSAIQHDPAAMRRWYLKTVDLVTFVAVVANTALLVNAHFFLVTFLGKGTDKWLPATLALRILCVYGIARAATEPLGPCLLARGRTKSLLYAGALAGAVELLLLLLVLRSHSIELVAAVVLIAYLTQAIIYLPYLRREFSIGFRDIIAQLWPIFPAMIAGYLITSLLPASFGGNLFSLAARGLFTAVIVALTHGLFSRFRCFQEARGMIMQNFARADRTL